MQGKVYGCFSIKNSNEHSKLFQSLVDGRSARKKKLNKHHKYDFRQRNFPSSLLKNIVALKQYEKE